MSKRRVSSSRRRSRGLAWQDSVSGWPAKNFKQGLKVLHFAGVSMGGGKTDRTALAMLDYYPEQNKIFLNRLFDKIKSEDNVSADFKLCELLAQSPGHIETLAFDVPLKLPKCLRCRLVCPGYEACPEPEIKWLWQTYEKRNQKRRPKKLFTPYTERCVEVYFASELEEVFHVSHAMGANMAPLLARALFLSRRLAIQTVEVVPKISVWRLGKNLQIVKSQLLSHKHAITGEVTRKLLVDKLVEKQLVFIYEQDRRRLIESASAFDAFICALTALLNFRKQCEPRPKDFPKSEPWVAFPKLEIKW